MRSIAIAAAVACAAALPVSAHGGETAGVDRAGQNLSADAGQAAHSEQQGEFVSYQDPPAAVKAIRSLFALQDAAANGHQAAIELQKSMISQIGTTLLRDISSPTADRLAPSVAGYVLSGGNPVVAERLAAAENVKAGNRHLLIGAALYMRGKGEEARKELKHVDATGLPASIGGRVALAQAMLQVEDHGEKQRMLQTAIALMPGSLVEESALRRSALAYAEAGNQQYFWMRAERYIRRFPRSLYAPEFVLEVVQKIVEFEEAGKTPNLSRLDLFLNRIGLDDRRKLYADLAGMAAARNLPDLTKFGARRLRRLALPGSPEAETAELYDWIFEAASENTDVAAERLRRIRHLLLSSRQRSLLEASLKVAEKIHEPIAPGRLSTADEKDTPRSAVERRADAVLLEVNALLENTEQ